MGCGKSTISKLLAESLNFQLLETDDSITKLTGRTIPDLFETEGESYFRAKEKEVLSLACTLDKIVISSGGGLPIFNDNINQMLNTGLTIYLKCDAEELAKRIGNDTTKRPLHNNATTSEQLITEVSRRLHQRASIYEEAHLVIDAIRSASAIKAEILSKMKGEY